MMRIDWPPQGLIILILLVSGITSLTACGQKGPLFLPEEAAPPAILTTPLNR